MVRATRAECQTHDKARDTARSRRPAVARVLPLLILLASALCILPFATHCTSLPAQPAPTYLIELGAVTVFPGESEFLMPVWITSESDLISWQMGLDYDDLLLSLIGVEFDGTESEPHAPSVQWNPMTPPFESLQVVYPTTPFPSGGQLLAAYLRFSLVDPQMIPPGGGIITGVAIVNTEPHPIGMMSMGGGTPIPATTTGTITLLNPPILEVGDVAGDFFDLDGVIEVPVRLWSAGPSTVLEMGLDYDDLLMCTFDLTGGAFEAAVGSDVTVSVLADGTITKVRIEALGGAQFPLCSGAVIGHLQMILGPVPFAGEYPLTLVEDECTIDGLPVANRIHGSLTLADHFIRGDANFDAAVQIADAMQILGGIITGGPLPCRDSADVNDDGMLDISDPIQLLLHLFAAGPPPAEPTTVPGPDPTADTIPCL
jgi:hypothetical protein